MDIKIYTDGGSLNNPGPAAYAFIIYLNEKIIFKQAEKIGVATNNVAEYTALIKALEKIKELMVKSLDVKSIVFFSDSFLMINQINGLFKVKNAVIREFILKIRILEQEIKLPIIYKHIPREQNTLADSLVKEQLRF